MNLEDSAVQELSADVAQVSRLWLILPAAAWWGLCIWICL